MFCFRCGVDVFGRRRDKRLCPKCAILSDKESSRRWLDKPEVKARRAAHARSRRRQEPQFVLAENLRGRIRQHLARSKDQRAGSAVRDLGCSLTALKQHLESKFKPGMSWDNYGEWHVDHIRPLASFDLTDRTQFLAACSFTNLQPLWAVENCRKGSSSPTTIGAETCLPT